ncbi:hypothetical protein ACFQE1_13055 [Halobium palmae]|uniref:Uncharacterized protein n=1 Tax=Halobium palmae TaxID=1776492 RepID=A0ABD5S134_9EURY
MDVRVDEARGDELSRHVGLALDIVARPVRVADRDDLPFAEGDVRFPRPVGVDDRAAAKYVHGRDDEGPIGETRYWRRQRRQLLTPPPAFAGDGCRSPARTRRGPRRNS